MNLGSDLNGQVQKTSQVSQMDIFRDDHDDGGGDARAVEVTFEHDDHDGNFGNTQASFMASTSILPMVGLQTDYSFGRDSKSSGAVIADGDETSPGLFHQQLQKKAQYQQRQLQQRDSLSSMARKDSSLMPQNILLGNVTPMSQPRQSLSGSMAPGTNSGIPSAPVPSQVPYNPAGLIREPAGVKSNDVGGNAQEQYQQLQQQSRPQSMQQQKTGTMQARMSTSHSFATAQGQDLNQYPDNVNGAVNPSAPAMMRNSFATSDHFGQSPPNYADAIQSSSRTQQADDNLTKGQNFNQMPAPSAPAQGPSSPPLNQKEFEKKLDKARQHRRMYVLLTFISGLVGCYSWYGTINFISSSINQFYSQMLQYEVIEQKLRYGQQDGSFSGQPSVTWSSDTCGNFMNRIAFLQADQSSNYYFSDITQMFPDYSQQKSGQSNQQSQLLSGKHYYHQMFSYSSNCEYHGCLIDPQTCDYVSALPQNVSTTSCSSVPRIQLTQNVESANCISDYFADPSQCQFKPLVRMVCNDQSGNKLCMLFDRNKSAPSGLSEALRNPPSTSQSVINCTVYVGSIPMETLAPAGNRANPVLFFVLALICGLITSIKEIFKVYVLVGSLCNQKFRQPGWITVTFNSPLILPFCFFAYYQTLIGIATKTLRNTKLVFMDLFFDSGLQLAFTIFLLAASTGGLSNIPVGTWNNLASKILTILYSVLQLFFGGFAFASDQSKTLQAEKKRLQQELEQDL
ncbi:hypothetical protein MP228_003041 [Amoeboaphelidium protococcarum]|nr:hypothetical protein MP228_003041 [Amoeboaphelidium protococcarum]